MTRRIDRVHEARRHREEPAIFTASEEQPDPDFDARLRDVLGLGAYGSVTGDRPGVKTWELGDDAANEAANRVDEDPDRA